MRIHVERIEPRDWEKHCAKAAHLAAFSEILPPEFDRIDFALLAVNESTDQSIGYLTARELDATSLYLKHGGSFEPIRGGYHSLATYKAFIGWATQRYERLTTLVENTNTVYLKFALHVGFRVIGIRYFKGDILLELLLEKGE